MTTTPAESPPSVPPPSVPPPPTDDVEVVVIGAGPVGVTVANYLGMYGVSTLVLDRAVGVLDYPRAIGLDDEALRSFQAIGLADDLARDLIQNVPLRMFDTAGRCFADIRPSTKEFGWFRRNIFSQPLAETTLRAGLERYPEVSLRQGIEVDSLTQDAGGVIVGTRDEGGRPGSVRARYAVAADGGRSTIRELAGIALEGETHPHKWVVIDVDNDPLQDAFTGLYCDPARPYVCAHMPNDMRRWEFLLFPGEDADAMLERSAVDDLLRRHVADPSRLSVRRARIYTHHSRVAQTVVQGRVILVGDAAHLMPPWAGQGLNTGIRDATNLAWKLAAVLRRGASPDLVRTYESERLPHARAMVDLSTQLGRMLVPTRRSVAQARDVALRSITWLPSVKEWILQMRFKPMPRYDQGMAVATGTEDRSGAVGRLMVQPRVETETGEQPRLDDVLGPWFAVVAHNTDAALAISPETRELADRFGVRFVKLVESRAGALWHTSESRDPDTVVVEDLENVLAPWFRDRGVAYALIRPDRYVAALSADDPDGMLRGYLERLATQPAATSVR